MQTPRKTHPSKKKGAKIQKILVIKLGALGDMVQASPFFMALRQVHPDAHITLLTTPPFAKWAKEWGLFQSVWSEDRHPFWKPHKWFSIWRKLGKFDHCIDLQGVDRTRLYTRSRQAHCISTNHDIHVRWRLQELANRLNLGELPPMRLPVCNTILPAQQPFVILVPGASKIEKCWPQECFAELAAWLKQRFGVGVVVIGREDFIPELEALKHKTNINDIVAYGAKACLSVGNDTGPQLLAAAGGCPTLTFYGQNNPPTRGGPWGGWQLYSPNVAHISMHEVQSLIEEHSTTWMHHS